MLRRFGREEALQLDEVRFEALIRFTQQAGDEGEGGECEDDTDSDGTESTHQLRPSDGVVRRLAERGQRPGCQRHDPDHGRTRALHHRELTEATPRPMPGDERPHAERREDIDREEHRCVAPGESGGGYRRADDQPRPLAS